MVQNIKYEKEKKSKIEEKSIRSSNLFFPIFAAIGMFFWYMSNKFILTIFCIFLGILLVFHQKWFIKICDKKNSDVDTGEKRRAIYEKIRKSNSYSEDIFKVMLLNFDAETKNVKHTRKFILIRNNVKLHLQKWILKNEKEETKIKGVIFFIHGYSSSSLLHFGVLCKALASKGYAVYAMDGYSHGLSDGLHCYIPDFKQYVNDYYLVYRNIAMKEKFLKKYLFGVSMGGAVALHILEKERIEEKKYFDGAIFSSPLIKVNEKLLPNTVLLCFYKLLCWFWPTGKFFNNRDKNTFYNNYLILKAVEKYPLNYASNARLKTVEQLYYACIECEKFYSKVTKPILAIHGENDSITLADSTRYFYDKISSPDKTLIIYKNELHGILFDQKASRIFSDIIKWLDIHFNEKN